MERASGTFGYYRLFQQSVCLGPRLYDVRLDVGYLRTYHPTPTRNTADRGGDLHSSRQTFQNRG